MLSVFHVEFKRSISNFHLHDWELKGLAPSELIYSHNSLEGGADCMRWRLTSNGKFSVLTYYECLRGAI